MANNNEDVMKLVIGHLDRIEKKVDRLDDRLDSQKEILIVQEANLAEHMRRSDLLEANQDALKTSVDPLLKLHTVAWGIVKIVGAIGACVGIVVGILKIMDSLV